MAEKHERGWIWDADEKAWIKAVQRRLSCSTRSFEQTLSCFQRSFPELFDQARAAARSFLEPACKLLSIDGRTAGRKYESLSPDEARELFQAIGPRVFDSWNEFMTSAQVVKAWQVAGMRMGKRRTRVLDKGGLSVSA